MNSQLRFGLFLTLFVFLFPAGFPLRAEQVYKADSSLKAYYKVCRDRIRNPEVPAMCDTLFREAVARGDRRMQVMALCTRLDHYYYIDASPEEIIDAVDRVKRFCTDSGRELMRYYYAVWANRLVPYYIRNNQANAAVYETCKMLAEAQKDDFPTAVANCYRILADIYFSQSNFRLAYDNYGAAIAEVEGASIRELPLSSMYVSRAECALELNMPDSAAVLIERGRQCSHDAPHPHFVMYRISMLYALHIRDYEAAGEILAKTEKLFREEVGLKPYMADLYAMQSGYFLAVGEYHKALESALRIRLDPAMKVPYRMRMSIDRHLGNTYWLLGDKVHAADSYRDYILRTDSMRTQESRLATNDLSGILEVVRLQNETRELQLGIQQRRLRNTYLIIFSLALVLLLAVWNSIRTMRLNRRLKTSEARVLAQNEELIAAGEELRTARDNAEQASRMKSDFIQNMSHEIRTPLNSIVGFSQVLASQFRNDPATCEYAAIIESSSLNLMRMVDDVLDIAILDQSGKLPSTDFCDMNNLCRECIDKILQQVHPGVSLLTQFSTVNPLVHINPRRVGQVLMHLLHNAAKFTKKGVITFNYTCLVDERRLRFTVTDTGPGIPFQKQEAVFERFVKLDAFTQGTGLGLPVCRLIAEKLGGSLTLDPTYTHGCRFIFEVPYDPTDTEA